MFMNSWTIKIFEKTCFLVLIMCAFLSVNLVAAQKKSTSKTKDTIVFDENKIESNLKGFVDGAKAALEQARISMDVSGSDCSIIQKNLCVSIITLQLTYLFPVYDMISHKLGKSKFEPSMFDPLGLSLLAQFKVFGGAMTKKYSEDFAFITYTLGDIMLGLNLVLGLGSVSLGISSSVFQADAQGDSEEVSGSRSLSIRVPSPLLSVTHLTPLTPPLPSPSFSVTLLTPPTPSSFVSSSMSLSSSPSSSLSSSSSSSSSASSSSSSSASSSLGASSSSSSSPAS